MAGDISGDAIAPGRRSGSDGLEHANPPLPGVIYRPQKGTILSLSSPHNSSAHLLSTYHLPAAFTARYTVKQICP